MKKFILFMIAVFTATFSFGEKSEVIKRRIFDDLMISDVNDPRYGVSVLQRERIVEILNGYNKEAHWAFEEITEDHIGWFILENSALVDGENIKGALHVSYFDKSGRETVETLAPGKERMYLCTKGLPFIEIYKKDYYIVEKEMANPLPEPRLAPRPNSDSKPALANNAQSVTPQSSDTSYSADGSIVINNYITCNGGKGNQTPQNQNQEQVVNYDGSRYAYRNNQWVNILTGAAVGMTLAQLLSNRFPPVLVPGVGNVYTVGSGNCQNYGYYSYSNRGGSYGPNDPNGINYNYVQGSAYPVWLKQ